MTAPVSLKTLKVSPDVHKAVHDNAQREKVSADESLRRMLGMSEASVRIPLEGVQRERWQREADAAGIALEQFVILRVEAALHWGTDPANIRRMAAQINDIHRAVPRPGPARRPGSGPVQERRG